MILFLFSFIATFGVVVGGGRDYQTPDHTASPSMSSQTLPPHNARPSHKPTQISNFPTFDPTIQLTFEPTNIPTYGQTLQPTDEPTNGPTLQPTEAPTVEPTGKIITITTQNPTESPTSSPRSIIWTNTDTAIIVTVLLVAVLVNISLCCFYNFGLFPSKGSIEADSSSGGDIVSEIDENANDKPPNEDTYLLSKSNNMTASVKDDVTSEIDCEADMAIFHDTGSLVSSNHELSES